MTRFLRPPSPEDYARMTQTLRREVAELVAAQTAAIEARRREIAPAGPPVYTANDLTAEEVRAVAHATLPRVQERWPDTPEQQAQRKAELLAAVSGLRPKSGSWMDERRAS